MQVVTQKDRQLASTITPEELGSLLSKVNWSAIPEEKRWLAQREFIARVMVDRLVDRNKAAEIAQGLILAAAAAD